MPEYACYEYSPRVWREKVMRGTFSASKRMKLAHRYAARGIRLRFEPLAPVEGGAK